MNREEGWFKPNQMHMPTSSGHSYSVRPKQYLQERMKGDNIVSQALFPHIQLCQEKRQMRLPEH